MALKSGDVFDCQRERLQAMVAAGLESVFWRQDQFDTGGIVESDVRVDGGRNLYWPWCWPREYIVEPLLAAGQAERVRRFLDFWLNCQREDGGWLHCYDVRDGKEYPGDPETDNVAYMLAHFGNYVEATDDQAWLEQNWPAIKRAGEFLESKYNPEMQMVWGHEEVDLPDCGKAQIRYSLHINCVSVWGLRLAAKLARRVGDVEKADLWQSIADTIFTESISKKLWDDDERTFAFGFTEDGQRLTTPVLWMTLMPLWLFGEDFADRRCDVLDYLKRTCYNKDPKISNTYWVYNLSPLLESEKPIENKYSGHGPWIGGLPVLIDAMISACRLDDAREQIEKICEFTNSENNLIPEHVNTIHPGEMGNYSTYPQPYYYVDSGNLLHLSFFLTMIARHEPEMLHDGKQEANVVNSGNPGNNSRDLLAKLESQVLSESPDLVVLMVGTNDCLNSQNSIPIKQYRENLNMLLNRISDSGASVIIMTLLPCVEDELLERHAASFYGSDGPTGRIALYNQAVRLAAEEHNAFVVDANELFMQTDRACKSLIRTRENCGQADGIHPTPVGYKLLARALAETIGCEKMVANKIVCYGDSITFGVHVNGEGSTDGETYPAQLKQILSSE